MPLANPPPVPGALAPKHPHRTPALRAHPCLSHRTVQVAVAPMSTSKRSSTMARAAAEAEVGSGGGSACVAALHTLGHAFGSSTALAAPALSASTAHATASDRKDQPSAARRSPQPNASNDNEGFYEAVSVGMDDSMSLPDLKVTSRGDSGSLRRSPHPPPPPPPPS
eukprot:362239-Chlamydomonas_euryale.AAC.4